MKKIGVLLTLGVFFVTSFYGISFLHPLSVFGYGYGYNCGGGYGYGYSCDGGDEGDEGDEGDDKVGGGDEEDEKDDDEVLLDEPKVFDTHVKSSVAKRYKKYKKKYKNRSAKNMYRKVKRWKKGTPEENARYLEIRLIYKQYKHLSKPERKEILTDKEYAEFRAYKKYRGYKKYKQLKKKVE